MAGDPVYAKDEVTRLADLLAVAIGGEQSQALLAPLLNDQPGWLAQVWPEWLNDYWQVPIEPQAQAYARQRVAGLAYPLPQTSGGVIPETDETNNRFELLFNASPGSEYDPLDADLILQMQNLLGSLNANPVFNFLWGVLGGETDYPVAIVINALLSMIPAVGLAFDVIGLFDPDNLIKFMSLIGIVTSLGEVTIVLPVVGQVSGPGAFVGDKAIAVTKASYKILKLAGGPLVKVLSKLPFDKAAKFGTRLLTLLIERGIKVFGKVNNIWTDAARLLDELGGLISGLWDSLAGLAAVLGAEGLLKYGGSEGGMLLGRLFNLSDDATDAALKSKADSIAQIADEWLSEAAADLTDEAVGGFGKLAKSLPSERLERVVNNLCLGGVVQIGNVRPRGLASLLCESVCDVNKLAGVLTKAENWDQAAEAGFKKVAGIIPDDQQLAKLLTDYASNPNDVLRRAFTIVGQSNVAWGRNAVNGVFRAGDEFGIEIAETIAQNPAYVDDVVEKTFEIFGSSRALWENQERFLRLGEVIQRHEISSMVVQRIDNLKDVDGIDRLVYDVGGPRSNKELGALFQLEYADSIPSSRISKLSDTINGKEAADILLDNSSKLIDTKRYVWSQYKPFTLERELNGPEGLLNQVRGFRNRYPSVQQIEYVFDSRFGPVPDLIRDGLKAVGVIVKEFP